MHLGNSHRWRRRLDDLRYFPGDLRRRGRSLRERLLANWAGYTLGQRASTSALALAVLAAIGIVVSGGGGIGDGTDLAVVTDRADRQASTPTTSNRRPPETSATEPDVTTAPPLPPGTGIELSMVDNSALVDQFPAADAEVLGATTVPGQATSNRAITLGNPFASLYQPPVTTPTPTAPSATVPAPGPTAAPATTRPPATAPPATAPPVTTPPVTAPPVTVPPVTLPPVTVPPTTAAPVTSAPPVTSPPTTVTPNP